MAQLQDWIEKYENVKDPRKLLSLSFVKNLQLGTVQAEYANLQLRYNELVLTLKDGVVFQQINNINREIEKIKSLNASQEKEKSIFAQELNFAKKDLERNRDLNIGGAISDVDMERVNTSLLQKERQYQGMNNVIIQNNIRTEQLELEKLKLREQRSKTIQGYQFSISEIIARIRSSIKDWSKAYMLEAPIDGKVTFTKEIYAKKNLKQGQIIGYILPISHKGRYISALLPSTSVGKIEIGQKSILKFDAYPYKEFGAVIATVAEISKIPELNKDGEPLYELRIPIPDIIVTDYNDTIQYKPKMSVIAEIVTEDKSVFTRIFDQFISIIKNT